MIVSYACACRQRAVKFKLERYCLLSLLGCVKIEQLFITFLVDLVEIDCGLYVVFNARLEKHIELVPRQFAIGVAWLIVLFIVCRTLRCLS
mgnify:CR=1 FL=1